MSKKATIQKTSAIVLAALMCAAPVQASETGFSNWVKSLFGMSVSGGGAGGGNPGVDPNKSREPVNASGTVYVPLGPSGGGGDPGVDPD